MQNIKIDLQIAVKDKSIPNKKDFTKWLNCATKIIPPPKHKNEICIRIIDEQESAALNKTYRHKSGATNILSFAYQDDELLGDLAICAPLIIEQAQQQNKELIAHWAHIVIHGYLHLLGFEHQNNQEAAKMEQLEVEILQKLGYPDPYL
jgi:probable rRNA maturation factor